MTEKKLTREEARELYDDLSRAMSRMKNRGSSENASAVGQTKSATQKNPSSVAAAAYARVSEEAAQPPSLEKPKRTVPRVSVPLTGPMAAMMLCVFFCVAKIGVSAFEAAGIGNVEPAQATVMMQPSGPQWSKEEMKVLTSLDNRRAELEERAHRLEQREHEFTTRDRDLAMKLTELKELSEKLKIEREKGEKQRNVQLDQLANVYGSMNPPEAAHLLEQLDIQIAHSLIQRMPEKRIGQILSLMNAERALELTNRLSARPAK